MTRRKKPEYEYLLMAGLEEAESRALIAKIRNVDRVNAELQSRLASPLIVLSEILEGQVVSKGRIRAALKSLTKAFKRLEEQIAKL